MFKDIFLYLSYSKSLSFIPDISPAHGTNLSLTLVPVQYS